MNHSFFLLSLFLSVALSLSAMASDTLGYSEEYIKYSVDSNEFQYYLDKIDSLEKTNPSEALKYTHKAMVFARKMDNNCQIAEAGIYMGSVLNQLGNHSKAIEILSTILIYAKSCDDREMEILTYDNIGRANSFKGRYDEALKNLMEGLRISQEVNNDTLVAKIYNSIGIIYGNLEDYPKSLECFNKSLSICQVLNKKEGIALSLNNIGNIYMLRSDLVNAKAYFEEAGRIFQATDDMQGFSTILHNLGDIELSLKNYTKASDYYEQSLRIKERMGMKSGMVLSYLSIAKVSIETEDFVTAETNLIKALAIGKRESLWKELLQAYLTMAEMNKKKGDYLKAYENVISYADYKDSLFSEEGALNLARLRAGYEVSEFETENEILKHQNEIHQLKLTKSQNLRNFILIASLLIITILIFVLNRIRIKKKSAAIVENKNLEIEEMNQKLKNINEQLEEKVYLRTAELEVEIQQRIKVEADLRQAKNQAENANRLKDAFLANMSHEIRTPLNGILGFIELLQDEDINHEQKVDYYNTINRSSEYLLNIINDIIDISKIEAGQLKIITEPFNLNELLSDLYRIYKNEIKSRNLQVELFCQRPVDEMNLVSDPLRIRQVFTNLLDNAVKFTSHGKIEFGYRLNEEGHGTFFVSDTGLGIDKEKQLIIFERFRQADEGMTREYGGTGLGLAISQGILQLMNGTIDIQSEPGKGATFTFTIPWSESDTFIVPEDYLSEVRDWKGKQILLLEDEEVSARYMINLLSKYSLSVTHLRNGLDVKRIIHENDFNLVFLDIQLPGKSGYEIAAEIKSIRPEIVIVAQTANAFSEDRERCLQAGCDDYTSKPIKKETLLTLLGRYL